VQSEPKEALAQANNWLAAGGGAAALHCAALALVGLRLYDQAARKLDEAAAGEKSAGPELRAQLLDQAGNAWLLAHRPGEAVDSFSAALTLVPGDEDMLADRARARGAMHDWAGAVVDLTEVLARDPDRADSYVLRASAQHALGKKAEARADLVHALNVVPDYPEALLERGTIKFEDGDLEGARADWRQVVKEAPGSQAGDDARKRLSALSAAARPAKR
jgi:tetratricopeptide (TPR) repeat protein